MTEGKLTCYDSHCTFGMWIDDVRYRQGGRCQKWEGADLTV